MSIISIKELKKIYRTQKKTGNLIKDTFFPKYEEKYALKKISFEIKEGELVGLIGPNGAGKTTTMKIMAGILYPTGGEIKILGHNPFNKDYSYLRQIGFVMGQKNQLIWDLPAIETFKLHKQVYDITTNNFEERLDELTHLLKCKNILNQPVKTLSLGQRMRMEIIASLLHSPKILFLDEPTIGLDILAQTTIIEFIKNYKRKNKATIILTSHYMQDVERLADKIIIIDVGKKVFEGGIEKLKNQYSQNKTLKISLKDELKKDETLLKNLEYKYTFPQLEIKTNKKELVKVLENLLKKIEYTDISIENETLEEIIKKKLELNKDTTS